MNSTYGALGEGYDEKNNLLGDSEVPSKPSSFPRWLLLGIGFVIFGTALITGRIVYDKPALYSPETRLQSFKIDEGMPSVIAATASLVQSSEEELDPGSNNYTIVGVTCGGTGLMALACDVLVDVPGGVTYYLEYFPEHEIGRPGAVQSPKFQALAGNVGWARQEIFRLRPSTQYQLNLFVGVGGISRKVDNATFASASTGNARFDAGPFSDISGLPSYPLLMFPVKIHGFRGVVATDSSGWIVWYYNASVANPTAHIIAAEMSKEKSVWCFNDDDREELRIIEASGNVLFVRSESALRMTGHECRFEHGTAAGNDPMRVIYLTQSPERRNMTKHLYNSSVRMVYENFTYDVAEMTNEYLHVLQVGDPTITHSAVENVSLNAFLSNENLIGFYNSNGSDAWGDLNLEFSLTTRICDDCSRLEYIHASAVSVSDDGTLFIVSFRDSHCVVGIHKSNHTKKFMLSSVIPGVGTHVFESDFDKFYNPHDATYYSENSTLCLMDDGLMRPQGVCNTWNTADDNKACYSRGLCYELDDATKVARVSMEFEFPNEYSGVAFNKTEMREDLYNLLGGSLRRVDDREWLISFTEVTQAPFNTSSWAIGFTQIGDRGMVNITSIAKIPSSEPWSDSSISGNYRANPIDNINGELSVVAGL